ncbi:MAG: cytochrome c family protein, partial [Desulfobacteraceae bacterium]|nr:cytochrome c family protein [Desulfobacteraceae bacterium]
MLKKSIISLILALFVLVTLSAAFASDGGPDGNKRKGKYTYRKVYKACAGRGEVDSATPKMSPADKTMAQ